MPEMEVGKVSDYFARLMVAGVNVASPIKLGDHLHVLGHTTDLEFDLASMQIDHRIVNEAGAGASVGIQVPQRVRPGDRVFLVSG